MMAENSSHVTAGVRNCLFLALMSLLSFTSEAECQNLRPVWRDIVLANGEVLTHVKVTKIDPDGLKIMSDAGLSKVMFTDLDPAIQKEFGYDPEKAAAFTSQDKAAAHANRVAVEESVARQKAGAGDGSTAYGGSGESSIFGEIPQSLETGKDYWVTGVMLTQTADEYWVADLLPKMFVESIPPATRENLANGADQIMVEQIRNSFIEQGVYKPGRQRVILMPADLAPFRKVNFLNGTIFSAVKTKFLDYRTIELTSGATARVPVFGVDRVKLRTGEDLKFGSLEAPAL